ncbi:hypothetical protein Mgra_00008260 [Meloidogyne graminicola]|uniref:Uncharacterized protein n=1 Tax=Meloidogyne graminicola TaxID=189291 RepID=A0A8S9ZGD1_9BILA|nr:hypothetical protein Mgra_00008260 [Meloidogyne graminicola]
MLEHNNKINLNQLLTSLHKIKLSIFDPLFCEQKIKSELPLLLAREAFNGSYKNHRQIIDEYLNKNDSAIKERF